jgi:hypothetical protein
MAKDDGIQNVMTGVAEAVGGALGSVAGQVDAIRAEHPHPVEEVREAIAGGEERVATIRRAARKRVKAAVRKTRKTVGRVKRRSAKVAKKARRTVSAARGRAVKAARKAKKKAVRARRRRR